MQLTAFLTFLLRILENLLLDTSDICGIFFRAKSADGFLHLTTRMMPDRMIIARERTSGITFISGTNHVEKNLPVFLEVLP